MKKQQPGFSKEPERHKLKVTITIPPKLWKLMRMVSEETFDNISAYIAHLGMNDLTAHGINPLNPPPELLARAEKKLTHTNDSKLENGNFTQKDPQIETLRKPKKPRKGA